VSFESQGQGKGAHDGEDVEDVFIIHLDSGFHILGRGLPLLHRADIIGLSGLEAGCYGVVVGTMIVLAASNQGEPR